MNFFGIVAKDLVWFAKKVKHGLITAAADAPAIVADIAKSQVAVEAITSVLATGAVPVEEAAYASLGLIAQAVDDAGQAAGANALNLTLDQKLIADIRAILPFLKSHAKKNAMVPTLTPATIAATIIIPPASAPAKA